MKYVLSTKRGYDDSLIPYLIKAGFLFQDQVESFILAYNLNPEKPGILDKLVEHRQVNEEAVARVIASQSKVSFIDLDRQRKTKESMRHMPAEIARFLGCVPYHHNGNMVFVAICHLVSELHMEHIMRHFWDCGFTRVIIEIATVSQLRRILVSYPTEKPEPTQDHPQFQLA